MHTLVQYRECERERESVCVVWACLPTLVRAPARFTAQRRAVERDDEYQTRREIYVSQNGGRTLAKVCAHN